MKELLNIVNDKDEVIGAKTREEIHEKGLLHREVHVYFITRNKEIIFQHRAKDKDLYPDLLDATIGGHVEIGQSYGETVAKEAGEETGVKINDSDLTFLNKIKKYSADKITGKINYFFDSNYLYIYRGDPNDLKIETGKAIGFEIWPIDKLLNLSDGDKSRFIPYVLEFITTELIKFIKDLRL